MFYSICALGISDSSNHLTFFGEVFCYFYFLISFLGYLFVPIHSIRTHKKISQSLILDVFNYYV